MPRAILNSYQIEGSFTFFFYYKIKKTLSLEDLIVYNVDIVMKRGKKMKKKKLLALSSIMMIGIGMASCVGEQETMATSQIPSTTTTTTPTTVAPTTKVPTTTAIPSTSQDPLAGKSEGYKKVYNMTDKQKETLSAGGYVDGDMNDYNKYIGTEAYKEVTNATELLEALKAARLDYSAKIDEITVDAGYVVRNNVRKNETNWQRAITKGLYLKNSDGTFTKIPDDTPFSDPNYTATMVYYEDSPYSQCKFSQTLNQDSTVHVIEVKNDINLGYLKLDDAAKNTGLVNNFIKDNVASTVTMSTMAKENGISQIAIERTNDLLIYSKNGAKLTHAGFKINYCDNITIRNIKMDEMWQWEDTSNKYTAKMGDYDTFGWAYFKIGFSDNIWIDHCKFGKSYDGQIDIANSFYESAGTYSSAPYKADGSSDVHISWCSFESGSNEKDGYIYKMMQDAETDYQTNNGKNYLYYKALRDGGFSFDQILNGIATPQKKGFLLGDSGTEYYYNLNLNVSIANCYFKDIEDRVPKLRGGNVYMYNCVVDTLNYDTYRSAMKEGAKNAVSAINSSWKAAFVSQGMVVGNGGSIMAQGTVFRGIQTLVKNNDSDISNSSKYEGATNDGGYHLIDFIYQQNKDSQVITDEASVTIDCSGGTTNIQNFKWNTEDGKAPFEPIVYAASEIEEILSSDLGAGTLDGLDEMWLYSDFTIIK